MSASKLQSVADVPYPGYLIKQGSSDKENIKWIQNALGITADGVYSTKIEAAIKSLSETKRSSIRWDCWKKDFEYANLVKQK